MRQKRPKLCPLKIMQIWKSQFLSLNPISSSVKLDHNIHFPGLCGNNVRLGKALLHSRRLESDSYDYDFAKSTEQMHILELPLWVMESVLGGVQGLRSQPPRSFVQ